MLGGRTHPPFQRARAVSLRAGDALSVELQAAFLAGLAALLAWPRRRPLPRIATFEPGPGDAEYRMLTAL